MNPAVALCLQLGLQLRSVWAVKQARRTDRTQGGKKSEQPTGAKNHKSQVVKSVSQHDLCRAECPCLSVRLCHTDDDRLSLQLCSQGFLLICFIGNKLVCVCMLVAMDASIIVIHKNMRLWQKWSKAQMSHKITFNSQFPRFSNGLYT